MTDLGLSQAAQQTILTYLVLHVREETPDLGREVDDVRGLELLEYRVGLRPVPEVAVLGRQEDPGLAGEGVGVGVGLDGLADKARPLVRWRVALRSIRLGQWFKHTGVCGVCACVVAE